MPKEVEFFFDFGSPYSWLSMSKLPEIVANAGAEVIYRPISILRLMPLSGNRATTLESRNKGRYANKDLSRWSKLYNVHRARNEHLKTMPLDPLLTGALVALTNHQAEAYVRTVFDAIYSEGINMGDSGIYANRLTEAGLDGDAILVERDDPELLRDIEERTAAAAERGLFGVPSFIVGEELFFGNDRLDFVATAFADLVNAD